MGKRGRPSKPPSDDERAKVAKWAADGARVAWIAEALERSIPNVRKYFAPELLSGKKIKPEPEFPFAINKTHRDKVAFYIGTNMSVQEVADAIGCTKEQLEVKFADEIRIGRAKAKAFTRDVLIAEAGEGGGVAVSAAKRLLEMAEAGEGGATTPGGKKAQQAAAAKEAVEKGGKFVPMAPPKLVIDNTA